MALGVLLRKPIRGALPVCWAWLGATNNAMASAKMARPEEVARLMVTRSEMGTAARGMPTIVRPFALVITDTAGVLGLRRIAAQQEVSRKNIASTDKKSYLCER